MKLDGMRSWMRDGCPVEPEKELQPMSDDAAAVADADARAVLDAAEEAHEFELEGRGLYRAGPATRIEFEMVEKMAIQLSEHVENLYMSKVELEPAVELEPRYPSWASKVFHRLLDRIFPDKARTSRPSKSGGSGCG